MKLKIGAILIILSMLSCMSSKLRREYDTLKSRKITIPNNLRTLVNGKDSLISNFFDGELKLIVYIDSTSCNSCHAKTLGKWNDLLEYAQNFENKLKFYFIMAPKKSEANSVIISLRSAEFDYPVILDAGDVFRKSNPHISSNKVLHTFLLDSENNVIMIGNPTNSSEIDQLFKVKVQGILNK